MAEHKTPASQLVFRRPRRPVCPRKLRLRPPFNPHHQMVKIRSAECYYDDTARASKTFVSFSFLSFLGNTGGKSSLSRSVLCMTNDCLSRCDLLTRRFHVAFVRYASEECDDDGCPSTSAAASRKSFISYNWVIMMALPRARTTFQI